MEYIGLNELIGRALQEDIGHGDITTLSLIPHDMQASGIFVAKSAGVLAGLNVSRAVYRYLEPDSTFETFKSDGDNLAAGDVIARVTGKAATLLTGERVALISCSDFPGLPARPGVWQTL